MPEPANPFTNQPATPASVLPSDLPHFPVFLDAPDLSPWTLGNTGIAGFTTRDSGLAGPHVVLVSLIHGNEFAGAIILDEMLRSGFKPLIGKLTFGFANIAAFEKFDRENPVASRFVEEDMNRVWDDVELFGVRRSLELDRARDMRPLIDAADIVLDLHSMLWPSEPLLLCGAGGQGRDLALGIATPAMVIADAGHAGGKRLIDYGRFTETPGRAACVLVEAGQHWEPACVNQMRTTIFSLLRHTGLVEGVAPSTTPRFAEVTQLVTARTNRFVFVRDFLGGEIIATKDTLIAHDGDIEIRTPHDNCLLVMPSLRPSRGHTAVRLAKLT